MRRSTIKRQQHIRFSAMTKHLHLEPSKRLRKRLKISENVPTTGRYSKDSQLKQTKHKHFYLCHKWTNISTSELSSCLGNQHNQALQYQAKLTLVVNKDFEQNTCTYIRMLGIQLECCSTVSLYDLSNQADSIIDSVLTRKCSTIMCSAFLQYSSRSMKKEDNQKFVTIVLCIIKLYKGY